MAMVGDAVWTISLTYADRDRNLSVVTFFVDGALTSAEAIAIRDGVISRIAALTDAVLVRRLLSIGGHEDSYPATLPPEKSNVENYGFFNFNTARYPVKSSISIPSFLGEKVIDGTNIINTTDADVASFVAWMIDTGIGAGNSPVGYAGDDLVSLASAPERKHRKNAKG